MEEKAKRADESKGQAGAKDFKMNFTVFVSGLLAEGLMALGVIKNPLTQEVKKDLQHASHVIDALNMLKEKTTGNLTNEESDSIGEAIHQLQMLYVAGSRGKKGEGPSPEGEAKEEKKDQEKE